MSFDYLNEAFKKLSLLNEETFDTSLTGLNQLSDFMDKDASDDVVKVIDTEAEFEDEVQDSYIGKVITNCNVCHSHIFENKDEIVIDEDGLVNAEKQCPYCGEQAGFTIVGEITPYVKETEEPEADPTVEVDGTPVESEPVEEPVEESVKDTEDKLDEGLIGGAAGAGSGMVAGGLTGAAIGGAIGGPAGALAGAALGNAVGGGAGALAGDAIQDKIDEDAEELDEAGSAVLDRPREKDLTQIRGTIADVLINHSAEIDACGANEAAVKDCITRILSSEEVKTPEAAEEAIRIINKCRGPKLWSTIGTYMSGLKVASSSKYARRRLDASLEEALYDEPFENWVRTMEDLQQPSKFFSLPKAKDWIWDVIDLVSCQDRVSTRAEVIMQKKGLKQFANDKNSAAILRNPEHPEYSTAMECANIIAWCIQDVFGEKKTSVGHEYVKGIAKDVEYSSRENVHGAADKLAQNYDKSNNESYLSEAVNNVNVETDDSIVNIQSEEGGKVTVSTEPKAPEATGEEAIGPLSDETLADIESANGLTDTATVEGEEEIPAEEEAPVESEEEVDIEEVDETALDELGESYLKEVYENVESFKTSNVSSTDTHLVVEGVIKFKSGATKKTGFIFEAHSVTPDGKVRFTGKNEHFSRGAKSFILTGTIENKKLISESFTYNYRAKTADGKSNRIYGTVSKK